MVVVLYYYLQNQIKYFIIYSCDLYYSDEITLVGYWDSSSRKNCKDQLQKKQLKTSSLCWSWNPKQQWGWVWWCGPRVNNSEMLTVFKVSESNVSLKFIIKFPKLLYLCLCVYVCVCIYHTYIFIYMIWLRFGSRTS